MKMKGLSLFVWLVLNFVSLGLNAGEIILKVSGPEPPKELGASIRNAVSSQAIQLIDDGKPIFEFWFRNSVPLKGKPETSAKALDVIDEITLLGVARVGEGQRDYKDNEISPGVYTIRFGLQPKDGDHLGTSEYPYFAVLLPVKNDGELDAVKTYKVMVKTSGKSTATGHPCVLSLRPLSSQSGDAVMITKPAADHEAIRVKLPAQIPESAGAADLPFELVYKGKFKS